MDSFHYLTNKRYSEITNMRKEKKTINFKQALTEKINTFTFYSMDWISQINFYNHYINHQVIFVTGSTGTGKSTEVPKLFLLINLKFIFLKSFTLFDLQTLQKVIY